MPRNFEQTLAYLYEKLPFFSRDGKKAIKNSLDNSLFLSELSGNPHQQFKSIHVGGTNGKGSVSHSLASVFQHHSFKTALYTSPHLIDFRERMRINGKMIPKHKVVEWVETYEPWIEKVKPSFFEITQAIAFSWFAEEKVDIAVIEVGMGGRLDSTNIITPLLSVITNISYDHQDMLGETLPEIASEKAGIIKANVPVIIGRKQTETAPVFIQKATSVNSTLYFASDFEFTTDIPFELKGLYQKENLQTIRSACKVLQEKLGFKLEEKTTRAALASVCKTTGLRGRWEVLQAKGPKIIADTGHNEEGLYFVSQQLQSENYQQLHIVMGMVADKNRERLWQFFPKNAQYYFSKPNIPRGLDLEILYAEATKNGLKGSCYESCEAAFEAAKNKSQSNDLIFVGGSTFVVAEILPFYPEA